MYITTIFGSNMGERQELLKVAKKLLSERVGAIVKESHLYETEPWGFESDVPFINQVVVYNTSLTPELFLEQCFQVENQLGRIRPKDVRYSSRTMDIDILYCENLVIDTPKLTVPHPCIAERRFVLVPLNELMSDFCCPKHKVKVSEMLQQCLDMSNVVMI